MTTAPMNLARLWEMLIDWLTIRSSGVITKPAAQNGIRPAAPAYSGGAASTITVPSMTMTRTEKIDSRTK